MSSTAKIRVGATVVIAGELFALVTMLWPRASTFVAFVFAATVVVLAGAVIGTWGVLEHERAPHAHSRRGEESPHQHVRRSE